MTATRVAAWSGCISVTLLSWSLLRPAADPVAERPAADLAAPDLARLEGRLGALADRAEALLQDLGQAAPQRAAAAPPTTAAPPPAAADESLVALQREVADLRLAVQTLAAGLDAAAGGNVSHNLAEIRRSFPTTQWAACEQLLQRALAEPGVDPSHLDSDKSTTLATLMMARPADILQQFGAPTRTSIVTGRFVWHFESPQRDAEGQPASCLEITFEKGYVWDVEFESP